MRLRRYTFLIGSLLLLIGGAVLLMPLMTQAQASLGLPSNIGGLGTTDLQTVISNIVTIIFSFLGILLVLLILYGGFLWMTSQGNEEQITKAKKVIISAVIGLAITLAAYSIAFFIISNLQRATGPGGPIGPPPPPPSPCPTCPVGCTNPGPGGPIKVCVLNPGTTGRGNTVTIKGYNFGTYNAATSKVIVQSASPVTAELISCQSAPQWTDNEIKFVVPSSINPGNFLIEVKNAVKSCTDLGGLCQTLAVDNTDHPSINCIAPTSGPGGQAVTIDGKNFGASADTVEMQGSTNRFSIGAGNITSWQSDQIKIKVPATIPEPAISGDINIKVGSQTSNGANFNVTCSANNQCASNCCSGNSCQLASVCANTVTPPGVPTITSISPNNGEVGNFITIQGNNFGATADTVHFQVGATDYTVTTPPAVACSATWWGNTQIIVAVPVAIGVSTNGPAAVTVENTTGESGSVNFDLNDTVRPGLCSINPVQGLFKDVVTVVGNNFTGATRSIQFGTIDGDSVSFSSATQATAKVPNIQPATIGVRAKVDAEFSNPLSFVVGSTASGQARIDYIDPTSGPTAQYVQIYGSNFGNSAGVVRFIKGPDTFIGDTGFPAACSANFWHNDHIVVKVPSDALATLGQYQVQVHPASGPDSNFVTFDKNGNPLAPGICALNPVRGPVNTPVTISGDSFATLGQVTFSNNKIATVNNWSNQQIQSAVPSGAVTGLVKVKTGSVESAGVPFEVGSCTNNTQCPNGSQCCGDGTCQASCAPTTGPQCKYRWSFTTGQNPFAIDIISQCTAEGQSPSPYPFYQLGGYDAVDASKNAPVDSAIAVRFTADLDFSSVAPNVTVYRCNSGLTPNEPTCLANPVAGTFSQWAGSRGFMFESAAPLASETWYKVELTANVLARDGSRLQLSSPLDTGWLFRTRSSAQANCQPTLLSAAPSGQNIYLGNSAQFSAAALDGSSCTFCHSSTLTWNWSTSPAAPNDLVSYLPNNNQVTATADKDRTGPGTMNATLVNSSLAAGQASFEVKSSDPFVTTFSPGSSCVSACTNSEIRANFNMPMKQATVEQSGAVQVFSCTDANCTSFGGPISATVTYDQDASGQRAIVNPDNNLGADTWYRVIIKNSVKNTYDAALSHLNYPIGNSDSFSWKFKTGNSTCTPDAISLTPTTYTAQVGQSVNYKSSVLVNTVPTCSAINLNAASYAWTWTSADTAVADVVSSNVNQAVVNALSLSLPTGVAITTKLNAFPAIAPASGTLYVTNGNDLPPSGPPLALVGHTPTGSPVCRNAQVAAIYNNQLQSAFSWFWNSPVCNPGPCPAGSSAGKVEGNKVLYRFQDPQALWPANSDITIKIQTAASDVYGHVWQATGNPSETWTFRTTDSICKIGYVEVTPHPYTFTTPNSSIIFTATAKATDGTPITGANYDWTPNNGPIITVVAPFTTQNSTITAQNKNGTDYAYCKASGTLAGQDLGQVTGHARITVDICENPWTLPPNGDHVYTDPQYDFSFHYCKDSLRPGSNDLPNLPPAIIRTPNSSGSGDVLKEHVFVVDPTRAGGTVTGGANQDPTFDAEPSAPITATVGDFVQFQLKGTDPEGDQFVMLADDPSLPAGASFNPYNGVFIWVPQTAGSFSPTFYLRNDGATNVATKSVTISVAAASASLVIPKVTMALPFNGSTIYANVGEEKNFTAGLLSVPAATVESFVWDFQDSGATSGYTNAGTSFSVKHTFAQIGVKQVTFRAKAVNGGWSQPAVVTVIVRRPVSWWTPILDQSQKLGSKLLSVVPKTWIDTVIAQATGQSYDVIVVRVMKNIEHLSPLDWYRKYAPNPNGNPTSTFVNGYPAIQDGTTTYVAAANINGSAVYTNIYLISYNASAKATTQKIVQQLIDTWSFNDSFTDGDNFSGAPATCHVDTTKLCNTDEECGAGDYCLSQKATIRRDVARYTNLHTIGRSLNQYATSHRFCQNNPTTPCLTNNQCGVNGVCLPFYPKLTAGSYVAGMSTSKWPSWKETFSTTLGATQPVDPVNKFDSCANNTFSPYDRETCWDVVARKFSCPADAAIFVYQVQQDTNYRLSANLETNSRFTWAKENQNLAFTNAAVCTGAPQSGICGNSVLEPWSGEVCDGGFTNICPTGSNNQRTVGCKADCSGWLTIPGFPAACGGACGNSQLDTPFEQCDVTGNTFLPANWSCSLGGSIQCSNQCLFNCNIGQPYEGKCGAGDGIVQLPEVCDDGAANGDYGKCNTTCSGYGEFCGDGLVNGTEECDGSQGLSGHSCPAGKSLYCTSGCKRDCSDLSPASVAPAVCGNNLIESTCEANPTIPCSLTTCPIGQPCSACPNSGFCGGEQCEPDLYLSPAPENSTTTIREYVCGDTSSGVKACKITGGYCNDGITQVPYESCDYSSKNRCSNDATKICNRSTCPEGQPCNDCPINPNDLTGPKGVCNLENGEKCDNLTTGCAYCQSSCQIKVLAANRCGDGVKMGAEVCDEGPNNGLPFPHCNATCTAGGMPVAGAVCGNGSPANGYPGTPEYPPEICDEGQLLNGTVGHCNGTCTGQIVPNDCGNGTPDAGEFCDADGVNGQPRQCNLQCSGWTTAVCGNNILEDAPYGTEACDLGATNGQPGSTCSLQCIIVPPIPVTGAKVCGDGNTDSPNDAGLTEVCDSGSQNGTVGKCWNDCTRYTKYCGDNQKQTPNDTTPSQAGFN